jgi:hypothetical protein
MVEIGAAAASEDPTRVALERALISLNGYGHRAGVGDCVQKVSFTGVVLLLLVDLIHEIVSNERPYTLLLILKQLYGAYVQHYLFLSVPYSYY